MALSEVSDGQFLVDGEPFRVMALTVHKVTRKMANYRKYGVPLPDISNPYKTGFMDEASFVGLLDSVAGTRFNTIHAYLRLNEDGYLLPFPESCVEQLSARELKLIISLPFHWIFFAGFESIETAVKKYKNLEPLVMWIIGAEVFDGRFRVPFDLIAEVNSLVKSISDVPTAYGNMPFNNSPGPLLRCTGARPVDCTDIIAYFDFTPLQLLSMSEFILSSWWMVQDNYRPLARKLLGFWFSMYNAFMSLMPRSNGEYSTIDSNLGFRHMLKGQLDLASRQGKPLMLAQAGLSDNPKFIAKQLKILDTLPLAGYSYWNSGNLDPDYDGLIDNTELLAVFSQHERGDES
jgi:hypothetical protein